MKGWGSPNSGAHLEILRMISTVDHGWKGITAERGEVSAIEYPNCYRFPGEPGESVP